MFRSLPLLGPRGDSKHRTSPVGSRSRLAVLVLTGALLLPVACSSDSSDSTDAADEATDNGGGGDAPTTTTDPDPTDGPDSGPSSDAAFPGDEWAEGDAEDLGFDPAVLEDLAAEAEANQSNCLVVVRDGQIAAEWYWNETGPETTQEVFSATKSVSSVLVGIAVDDGDLEIDASASEWIPEWVGTPAEEVTVENLLSNDSGRFWSFQSDYVDMIQAGDRTQFAIDLEQTDPPGSVWAYNNAAIQTLEAVLESATGEQVPDFAEQRLFAPLGMDDTELGSDPAGNGLTFMGVSSSCRDMARFGWMVLNEGTWEDEQVVSSEWLEASTAAPSQDLNASYGYLWWINHEGPLAGAASPTRLDQVDEATVGRIVPDAPEDMFWAQGLGGQIVQVHRATDTVVVRLGVGDIGAAYGSAETSRFVTEALVDP